MGEVPIGAVLVDDESGVVVAAGHNLREINHDATAHAEMEVIRKAISWNRLKMRFSHFVRHYR